MGMLDDEVARAKAARAQEIAHQRRADDDMAWRAQQVRSTVVVVEEALGVSGLPAIQEPLTPSTSVAGATPRVGR
jgi:hypothetical protein